MILRFMLSCIGVLVMVKGLDQLKVERRLRQTWWYDGDPLDVAQALCIIVIGALLVIMAWFAGSFTIEAAG